MSNHDADKVAFAAAATASAAAQNLDVEAEDELHDLPEITHPIPSRPGMFVSDFEQDSEEVVPPENPDDPKEKFISGAENGNEELIRDYLVHHPEVIDSKDNDGYTALHRACYSNHPNIVQLLLDNGASVNAVTNLEWTPLHSAARWNAYECVKILLKSGADVNAKSEGGQTPLHLAAELGEAKETLTMLLLHPKIDAKAISSSNDSAYDIASRSGKYSYLFELARDSINKI